MMAGGVNATYIESGSSEWGLGSFTGDLLYDPTTGILNLTLENTSDPANEGYLTGVVLNNPGGIDGIVFSDSDFDLIEDVAASPYGTFDFGAALGGNFLGGGNPKAGVGVGQSKTFEFAFTGPGIGGLTDQSFINAFSSGGSQGDQFMLTRFQGFADGGSDKVPAAAIPEPATIALLFGGLGVLGFNRFRKKRKVTE